MDPKVAWGQVLVSSAISTDTVDGDTGSRGLDACKRCSAQQPHPDERSQSSGVGGRLDSGALRVAGVLTRVRLRVLERSAQLGGSGSIWAPAKSERRSRIMMRHFTR